jgi:FAD binding domain
MTITGTIELAGLDGGHHTLTSEQLEDLDSRVQGRLLVAGDQGWNDAVAIWNGMAARLPALVLQPASAHDVATAVSFARDHGLLLSVKGGGHNIAGTSMAPGGLTLDLSRMREIAVDPDAKLAHVGPGCLLGDVDQATQAHGLATVLGFVSETGVAGLTLGGGLAIWPAGSAGRSTTSPRSRSSPPTAASAPPTATSTPSCSGPCAVVAATSGSSPGSASACTRSARPSPAASSSGARSGPPTCWPPTATSPSRRRES